MGLDGILNVIFLMRCLIISDTTTHSKYWHYKYVQLLGGRKHTFAPPLFILGGRRPSSPPAFYASDLKGCPDKLKHTGYYYLINCFMEYGATVLDSYQKYNSDKVERVQCRAARLSKVGI